MAGCEPQPPGGRAGPGWAEPPSWSLQERVALSIDLGGHAHVPAFALGMTKVRGAVLGQHLEGICARK